LSGEGCEKECTETVLRLRWCWLV